MQTSWHRAKARMETLRALLQSAREPALRPPMLKPVSVSDVLTNPAPAAIHLGQLCFL